MTISWVNSEGQTGIAENAYDFAMQHSGIGSDYAASSKSTTPEELRTNEGYGVSSPGDKYPTKVDVGISQGNDLSYGSNVAPFLQEGAGMRTMPTKDVINEFNKSIVKTDQSTVDLSKAKYKPVDAEQAVELHRAWLATNRSATAALGFDPRVVVSSNDPGAYTLKGFQERAKDKEGNVIADQIWIDRKEHPELVHESIHRGLKLLKEETGAKFLHSDEVLTRALMKRHFGDIEQDLTDERMLKTIEGVNPATLDYIEKKSSELIARKRGKRAASLDEDQQPTMHEQLASFQQRLDSAPPEEAGALRKFLGSLNIMPAPNKPQEEWSAKEHLGVILNQAMAGMGAGWRGAGTIAPRNFKAAFNKIEPPANANEPGGVPGISRQINPTAAEEAALMDSWNRMVKESRKADLKVIEGGKGLTTETIPQLQQAQHRGPSEPVPPKTMITPAIEQLTKYEELSSQGKTTKQIVKGTKLDLEQVREALGRDNLAIAAFNSENALTNSYFKSLERLDPALGEALKKQVSVKDLKRYTRGLPEERLKTIFEELPSHVKEAFESGEQRRLNIDASKKAKIIPKPLK